MSLTIGCRIVFSWSCIPVIIPYLARSDYDYTGRCAKVAISSQQRQFMRYYFHGIMVKHSEKDETKWRPARGRHFVSFTILNRVYPCPCQPGRRPHSLSAYVKALLLKLQEGLPSCTLLRRFLLEHPLLVLELGFRPVLDYTQPYGFDVARTVPSARWLREQHAACPSRCCKPCWPPPSATCASISRPGGSDRLRCDAHLCLGAGK